MAFFLPKRRNSLVTLSIIIISFAETILFAAGEIKFEGEVSSGLVVEELKNGRSKTEAELKIETERTDDVKAALAFEVSNTDKEVELEEIYIDSKFS